MIASVTDGRTLVGQGCKALRRDLEGWSPDQEMIQGHSAYQWGEADQEIRSPKVTNEMIVSIQLCYLKAFLWLMAATPGLECVHLIEKLSQLCSPLNRAQQSAGNVISKGKPTYEHLGPWPGQS